MVQILVQFEEATIQAIDRISPAARRKRADFIRNAVKDAICRFEEERTRQAYLKQPDSEAEADSWDNSEPWAG